MDVDRQRKGERERERERNETKASIYSFSRWKDVNVRLFNVESRSMFQRSEITFSRVIFVVIM